MLESRSNLPVDSSYKGVIGIGQEDAYTRQDSFCSYLWIPGVNTEKCSCNGEFS